MSPLDLLALPPFPAPAAGAPPLAAAPAGNGVALRPAGAADLPFLMRLHTAHRMPELLPLPWSVAERRAFAEDQFRLQHVHFARVFPRADFWVVERADAAGPPRPIGRLTLDRTAPDWRLIDILLAGEVRGRGIGAGLVGWVQRSAAAAGAAGVTLHVAVNNTRVQALYARLGFVAGDSGEGLHVPMRWPSSRCASIGS